MPFFVRRNMQEIWRDIKNYEGLYQVSNKGNVRSIKFNRILNMKLSLNNKGYYIIKFRKKGKQVAYLVHRLVAKAFIPNPNKYPCINHKDENPQNNNVNNLEWCTYKQNNNYGKHNENLRKTKSIMPIICVELNKEFISQHEASRKLKINQTSIWQCLHGNYKTAGGYHWKFKK